MDIYRFNFYRRLTGLVRPDDSSPANVAAQLRVNGIKCDGTFKLLVVRRDLVCRVNLILNCKIVPVSVAPPAVDQVR